MRSFYNTMLDLNVFDLSLIQPLEETWKTMEESVWSFIPLLEGCNNTDSMKENKKTKFLSEPNDLMIGFFQECIQKKIAFTIKTILFIKPFLIFIML